MTLYEYLIETCRSCIGGRIPYEHIAVDLEGRTITLGKKVLLHNGVLTPLSPVRELIDFSGDPYTEIERLYHQFKHSVPSRMERVNRGYFRALSPDRLTMEELEKNMHRMEARVQLEAFICLSACTGLIAWKNPGHYFWQGNDPDCIIYKNWISKGENANGKV